MSNIILKPSTHEKKNLTDTSDTIAAISTPPGEGGIGIVRLSGRDSIEIADKLIQAQILPSQMKSHTVCLGKVIDIKSKQILDEVLTTVMFAPNSYTCEDVVEIGCHGGNLVLSKVLEQTLKCGARLAEAGEFTLRAFLNGRIDLAQAEAVADLIKAKTDSSLKVALQSLEGKLSQKLNDCQERLVDLLAEIEFEVDFMEEDAEELDRRGLRKKIGELEREIESLLESYLKGHILKEGLNIVIVGSPNVGKSSLLNALLGEERAIVTPIPGTTTDTIAEYINMKGIPTRLVDTAGFCISKNRIELEGIRRAQIEIDKADLVIWVVDLTKRISDNEKKLDELISNYKHIIALNKIDAVSDKTIEKMEKKFKNRDILRISALQCIGIKEIRDYIVSPFIMKDKLNTNIVISNLRHKQLLEKSLYGLKMANESLLKKVSPEFIALDLRIALDSIGEIVGKVVTDDILDRIFCKFCVGK